MLKAHIVDLHLRKITHGESLFEGVPGVVRVDMDLYDISVGEADDGIPHSLQPASECLHLLISELVLAVYHKFRTIAKADIRCGKLSAPTSFSRGKRRSLSAPRIPELQLKLRLFPLQGEKGAVEDRHEPLPAGVDDTGFLQNR